MHTNDILWSICQCAYYIRAPLTIEEGGQESLYMAPSGSERGHGQHWGGLAGWLANIIWYPLLFSKLSLHSAARGLMWWQNYTVNTVSNVRGKADAIILCPYCTLPICGQTGALSVVDETTSDTTHFPHIGAVVTHNVYNSLACCWNYNEIRRVNCSFFFLVFDLSSIVWLLVELQKKMIMMIVMTLLTKCF